MPLVSTHLSPRAARPRCGAMDRLPAILQGCTISNLTLYVGGGGKKKTAGQIQGETFLSGGSVGSECIHAMEVDYTLICFLTMNSLISLI